MKEELGEIIQDLRCHLAWQQADGARVVLGPRDRPSADPRKATAGAGVPGFEPVSVKPPQPLRGAPVQAAPPAPAAAPAKAPSSFQPVAVKAPAPARVPGPSAPAEDGPAPKTLDEIRRELGDCKRCKLCQGRTQLVFGVGNPRAELVFVGEGPGAEEDAQGVPFVGKAGQLLTKMIEAMGYRRDDVYICNVVKCRPPNNRNPEPDEIEACEPFLKAQLRAIGPKAIVALGKFAAQTLLRDPTPISRLRGNWRTYEGVPLMPTFHPAYLLRTPGEKKLAWADLQQVMKLFGKEPKKPS